MKKILLVCIMIMLMLASACGNVEMTSIQILLVSLNLKRMSLLFQKTHPNIVL